MIVPVDIIVSIWVLEHHMHDTLRQYNLRYHGDDTIEHFYPISVNLITKCPLCIKGQAR